MGNFKFDPVNDIPDLSGKTILVTGGTAGLGQQTIALLAQHKPSHIYFTGRSAPSAETTSNLVRSASPSVPTTFVPLDLANLSSVRTGAQSFLDQSPRLDILICNAGIMAVPPGLTADGYELQFGTNHLGHALLIQLLLPKLLETAARPDAGKGSGRLVALTSQGYAGHPMGGILFDKLRSPMGDFALLGPWQRYGQSKLANLLYANALAKRYPQLTVTAIHPGVILTGLVDGLSSANRAFVKLTTVGSRLPLEQGCWNSVWAATSEEVKSGVYYEPVGVEKKPLRMGTDEALAEKLWEWTEGELKEWLKV